MNKRDNLPSHRLRANRTRQHSRIKKAEWGGHHVASGWVHSACFHSNKNAMRKCNYRAEIDGVEYGAFRRFGRGALSRNAPQAFVAGQARNATVRLPAIAQTPLERRPADYQVVADNCAVDFQRVAFAADISQHFEEPKPVTNVYRDVSSLLKLLENFVVGSKFDKRAVGHVNLPLPALLIEA